MPATCWRKRRGHHHIGAGDPAIALLTQALRALMPRLFDEALDRNTGKEGAWATPLRLGSSGGGRLAIGDCAGAGGGRCPPTVGGRDRRRGEGSARGAPRPERRCVSLRRGCRRRRPDRLDRHLLALSGSHHNARIVSPAEAIQLLGI